MKGLEELSEFEVKCDHCLLIPSLRGATGKESRLEAMTDLLKLVNSYIEAPSEHRFTREVFVTEFLEESRFDPESENLSQIKTVKAAQKHCTEFMRAVETIQENVFGRAALQLLELKKEKRSVDL